ncbi:MAG: hypothetical protein HDT43_06325 [Ruminococcaceae bacterium]|nr:hypothetical protein [Oscillospiraceae bacterium]
MGLFSGFEQHHKKDPVQRVLESLHGCLETKDEIRDGKIFCPEWNVTITPEIDRLEEKMAILNFHITSPDWEEPLFECCAGMGKDTDTAIGMATGSFLFAFMQGIALMKREEDGVPLESKFAGHTHRWRVYKSNVVGNGESTDDDAKAITAVYWDLLKEHIAKRLGNQKLCYVKIYAAKAVGADEQITGECRINDVPSAELGALVGEIAAKWNVTQFASQKQFFFIKQEPETVLPYPYGENKLGIIREKVKTALELFGKVQSQEDYDALPDKLADALGDKTLAEECFSFLPEICAENAFNQIAYSEEVQFATKNGKLSVYKNQLADFYPLGHMMFNIFDSGCFGEHTNDLYKLMVSLSSIFGIVQQMNEKGNDLSNCRMTSLLFNVSEDFEIR